MLLSDGELDGQRLLGPKTVALMRTNHMPGNRPYNDVANGYGFGLGVNVLVDMAAYGELGSLGSYGWGGAANTTFWIDPAEDLVGLLMTQFMPSGHFPLNNDFRTLVYQSLVD
jgi:CubicO group peptidase (beta-lactamase class C family)